MMGKGMEGSQGRDTVRGGGLCFLNTMGEIPRGDLAQSLGGGWGHVLSSLPVVLGLSLWGLCLEILNKRGQRVPEEGATGWAGEATFFSCTKVNSMSVRLEISSSYLGGGEGGEGEAGTHTHTETAQLDVVDLATVCLTLLVWGLGPLQSLWCLVAVRIKWSLP